MDLSNEESYKKRALQIAGQMENKEKLSGKLCETTIE